MHTLSHRSRSQNRSQRYTHNQIEYHELDKTFKGVRKTFVTIMKCYMYELILAGILIFGVTFWWNEYYRFPGSGEYASYEVIEYEPAPPLLSHPDTPGNLGEAVEIPPELLEEATKRYEEHKYNVVANEMLPVNRTLEDGRYEECLDIVYPQRLPEVTIIIVFHNEAWSALTRTLWSVINTTPRALLKEIILVDDFSTNDVHGYRVQDYINTLPVPTIQYRTPERVGLIQARLLGASKAIGKIMIFLDAHIECNERWLEPLITPIVQSRNTVVTPIIDVINYGDMSISPAHLSQRGSFDLSLTFTWDLIPENILNEWSLDRAQPIESPAMAGGIFAIDRQFFYEIGSYDEKMKIWGGENLEMSIRIWSCGGRLIISPCSRVAHIFREETPYTLPGGANHIIQHNTARLVDVWFDEYKWIYYAFSPTSLEDRTDVTERLKLREELKCKPFKWYLENVFPQSSFNINNYRLMQILAFTHPMLCLDSMGDSRDKNRSIGIIHCHGEGGNQMFMQVLDNGEIREQKFCLDATAPGKPVKLLDCHGLGGNQYWQYDEKTKEIKHGKGEMCLTFAELTTSITILPCDHSDVQQWIFKYQKPQNEHVKNPLTSTEELENKLPRH